ncbi:Response regulator receiver protein [Hyella patelloides LEGE 07179]|uniref:Response regulator receiver protein n=1 Tax=Hyella patelloides LEGE 07179 TaxID=945734 RepID=A0A563VZ18_9CYAN|nr:response regulator [Hyella patelloides]VEP16645.1 Response regulator receiver protein [Hyella patelloides LEGE 07179]
MSEPIVFLVLSFKKRNRELLSQVLVQADYQVIAVGNYEELEQALFHSGTVNLGLIDLAVCDRRIGSYCEQLQAADIPFFAFTPQYNPVVEQDSLAHGARSVLVKPLVIKNLLSLINSLVGKLA